MKNVKVFLLLLITLTLSSCFHAATASSDQTVKNENISVYSVNPPGVYPIVNEPITLNILVGNNFETVEDLATNDFTKWYEELTNIHIEWDVVSSRNRDKVTLLLATNALPDIIMGTYQTSSAFVSSAKHDMLLPLNDYIDKYGPSIKKMLETAPITANYSYTPDGNIYALCRAVDSFNESMPKRCWIYQPWLDKLGIEMPETTEAFYDVLTAFRDMDPNGNGLYDEIPFAGSDKSPNGEADSFILNSFLYYDRNNCGLELLTGGKIRFNLYSEEYREGLRFLNRLVVEELLMPATYTQDRNALKVLTEGGEVNRLGVATAFYWGHFTNDGGEKGRDKEFAAVPVLAGPNGVRYAYNRGTLVNGQRFEITKNCKYPEAAIRWADYFFDAEGMMERGFSAVAGQENVSWKRADGETPGINGMPAKYEYIIAPDQKQNNHWFQIPPYYESMEYINSWSAVLPSSRKEAFGTDESMAKYAPYSALDKMVPFMFTPEEYAQEYYDKKTKVSEAVEHYRRGFVLGEYSLDTDWDMYLDELYRIGIERYVELIQAAYDIRIYK